MPSYYSKIRKTIRHRIAHQWGMAWRKRSAFISSAEKQQAHAYLADRQADMIYLLGSGRSGTQLMSGLLDASEQAAIYHEPNFRDDVATMDQLRRDATLATMYWREFRSVEVFQRWRNRPTHRHYGEVNGTIRYQAPAIKALFPQAKVFLLARDGRGFVRSVMGYPQFYGERSYGAYALAPLPGDPFHAEWSRMNRFEKICWSWRDTNEFLFRHIPPEYWLQLELLATDYDYVNERLAIPTDIAISQDTWRSKTIRKSKNASTVYGFPAWEDWSTEQQEAFIRICGDTMVKLGYPAL